MLIAERQISASVASAHYGASEPLVQMRLNVSGAALRVVRRRAAWGLYREVASCLS